MKSTVNIVGAGIAGLAAAIRLASRGHAVTVFEQSDKPGGKLNSLQWEGFRWDTGPSLFSLPDLVEELYVLAGEEMKTSIRYERLEVITRYFYEEGYVLNAFGDPDHFVEEVEKVFGEPAERIRWHLERSKKMYELTSDLFIFNKFYRMGTFMSQKFMKAFLQIWKLDTMQTMHDSNAKRFESKHLVQLFDRYATYNGSDPYRAPGTLNVISHLEHNLGVYFPERGMYSLATGLKELADKLGVVFHFNQPVEKVVMNRKVAQGVVTEGGIYPSDVVISDIDIFYLYRDLLEDIPFPVKQFKKERSTSALIFYWAMDHSFPQLDLHNVFFSANYQEEFRILSHMKEIYDDPTVYLFITYKKVSEDAPEGKENWYVMINVPENLGQDWDSMIEKARNNILNKLYRILGVKIEPLILKEFIEDPRTIESNTFSHRGSLYGNSSNSRIAAFSRHPNFIRKYKGLYFVGGSVHPGGSIPLCLASAKIVDRHIRDK
ncbi:MAG: phytoene desaturase [Bacteroidales bacterium]|nr:phytoene desaturase [Bacteroidales bacterium]